VVWGREGIILSAGDCVAWLVDLGLIADPVDSSALAATVESPDGVSFVPALVGLGTPYWDFGARGAFFGLTRGSSRAHLVRVVLEGVAHRGGDLVAAADAESGAKTTEIRIDGGMSANDTFVAALANATGCVISVSPEREATTRGAGLMALVAAGALSEADVASLWHPTRHFEPTRSLNERASARASWARSVERARATIPELSAVSF
jgi:glycerol kinase